MRSAPHRENLLNPSFNVAGFGVVRNGYLLFVTQDFGEGRAPYSTQTSEDLVASSVAQMRQQQRRSGLQRLNSSAAAARGGVRWRTQGSSDWERWAGPDVAICLHWRPDHRRSHARIWPDPVGKITSRRTVPSCSTRARAARPDTCVPPTRTRRVELAAKSARKYCRLESKWSLLRFGIDSWNQTYQRLNLFVAQSVEAASGSEQQLLA
jgi:hypothetical protein